MNNLLAVMEAVTYSTATGSNQQLADGNATTLDVGLEQTIYADWNAQVAQQAAVVNTDAENIAADPGNQALSAQLTADQTKFQNMETEEQTYTQQADSATQAMQTQTGQDSSSLQQKTQLEAAINQVLQMLASALGQHY